MLVLVHAQHSADSAAAHNDQKNRDPDEHLRRQHIRVSLHIRHNVLNVGVIGVRSLNYSLAK